jgi:hypothetical protein
VLEEVDIVMSHAAEKCDFANRLAEKNNIDEVLHTDVQELGEAWATSFVDESVKKECQVILVMARLSVQRPLQEQDRQLTEQGLRPQGVRVVHRNPSYPFSP